MYTNISCFIILFTFRINICFCKKYYNYTLFRGIPYTDEHLQFYEKLKEDDSNVNFWREPGALLKPVEFVVSPEAKSSLLQESSRRGLYLTTIMEDVQQ